MTSVAPGHAMTSVAQGIAMTRRGRHREERAICHREERSDAAILCLSRSAISQGSPTCPRGSSGAQNLLLHVEFA